MKKGSLNISIEAIVIIVIAMTILGLGLVFVRKQFTDFGATTSEVQEQVREQTTSILRSTGEKVSFPRQIQFSRNEQKVITLGVQNTGSATLNIRVKLALDPCNSDAPGKPSGIKNCDEATGQLKDQTLKQTFENLFTLRYLENCLNLAPSVAEVYGVNVKAPNVPGSFALKAEIQQYPDPKCAGAPSPDLYATKISFLTVG